MYQLKELTIRTNNSQQGISAIIALWSDILKGKYPVSFKGKPGIFPVAKYSNYETDEKGAYDYTIMEASPAFIAQKEAEVRKGLFKKYEVVDSKGDLQACTKEAWMRVYNDQKNGQINRAFTSDFETSITKEFTADGSASCRLYIAVK